MEFEFDANKSRANKKKHGIDFVEAQMLWGYPCAIESKARSTTEHRFRIVGKILEMHYSAFITYRGGSVRIVSVRRSRKQEVSEYEKSKEGTSG